MKKTLLLSIITLCVISLTSCNKEACYECEYPTFINGVGYYEGETSVECGTKSDIEKLEKEKGWRCNKQ